MKTEQVFGHKAKLEDYTGPFPATAYFEDIKDGETKKIEVPEEAWEAAIQKNNETNLDRKVIFKYMAKRDDVKIL